MSEPDSATTATGPPNIPDHELLRQIGEGSYGAVWLARSTLGTYRAVKVVLCPASGDERASEREFTGLKNFEPVSRGHEGVVDILQVGRSDGDNYFYYVMELADGVSEVQSPHPQTTAEARENPTSGIGLGTLDWRTYQPLTLENKIRANGRLPVPECIRIAATLAAALRYLHAAGLVHRDLKPSNIIFVDGVPKLADVGLVARTDSARTFVGTEGYIPPEGPGAPSADIYSLGKCLYEMAMGKDRQAYPSPPTLLDELPDRQQLVELNEVITRACEQKPADRYETATAMHGELELLRAGLSVQKSRKQQRRRRILRRVATVAVSLLAIGGAALYLLSRPHLVLVKTLEMPAEWVAHPPLVGDWKGNGQPTIYMVGDNKVWLVSATGLILNNQRHRLGEGAIMQGDLVADVDGSGATALFLSWANGANLHVGVFDRNFVETSQFKAQGLAPTNASANRDSTMHAAAFADFKKESRPNLITRLMTGKGGTPPGQPREVRCYDYKTGIMSWSYPTAAWVNNIQTVDLDGDGVLDLLFGSVAVNNGVKLPDGTDDEHCYLYAISGSDGRELWKQKLGDIYAACEPLVADVEESERKAIFAFVSRGDVRLGSEVWPRMGHIVRLNDQGVEERRTNVGTTINGMLLADSKRNGKRQLLVTDASGFLHLLDLNLNQIGKLSIVPRLYDWVDLRLVAVTDLDGDGRLEMIFTSQQIRQLSQSESREALDNCVLVFSADLKPLAKYVLAERWENWRTAYSVVIDDKIQRHKSIVVFGDKVHFLRYSRW